MNEHITVLLEEAVAALNLKPDGHYLDATFGRGGHSRLILSRLNPHGRLYALDRDPEAAACAAGIADPRFHFFRTAFSRLDEVLPPDQLLDGALFDLGISSPQVDRAERGFSFSKKGAIDMRMDNQQGPTAYDLLTQLDDKALSRIIRDYGGEPHTIAQRIARAIRQALPHLQSTTDLAAVVAAAVPQKYHKKHQHPATQTFQALRIAVNDEFGEIEKALTAIVPRLRSGGRLVVISFHSDEDALVKRFLRRQEGEPLPPELPTQGRINQQLQMVGPALRPSAEALSHNPRARSAVLRLAVKL